MLDLWTGPAAFGRRPDFWCLGKPQEPDAIAIRFWEASPLAWRQCLATQFGAALQISDHFHICRVCGASMRSETKMWQHVGLHSSYRSFS